MFKSPLLRILKERGFLYQLTHEHELDALALEHPITAYVGFDATANTLQVGNLMMLMIARWFQETGHRVILLLGGGTTRIGDPSGKDAQRQLLSQEQISANISGIEQDMRRVISLNPESALMVNNADWLDSLGYIDFLRDIGVHFSINRMLSFDHVKSRLDRDQPLSFIEFNYSLLQAYDFVQLAQNFDCAVQFGGSDQWGNIVSGVDLVRKVLGKSVFGFTVPLLMTSSGLKMGKSVAGAVWLNPEKTSPYEYWQFWRNTEDADVYRFLKLYTLLPLDQIAAYEHVTGEQCNKAKILLADEATALVHGRASLDFIHETVRQVFQQGGIGEALPSCEVLEDTSVLSVLCSLGFVGSMSEALKHNKPIKKHT